MAQNDALAMAKVAADLAARSGISAEVALRLLQGAQDSVARPPTRPGSCSISHDEYSVLQRIALMAGALLPHMRRTGIAREEFATYTALRDALVELQVLFDRPAWAEQPLSIEDIIGDLQSLERDLAEPPAAPPTP